MEENQTMVNSEDTAPQVETENTATEVDTNTNAEPTIANASGEADTETNTSEENEQAEQNGTDDVDSAPFLSVRFNHEDRELTQAEAQSFAQKGMQAEPLMADLRYLAAQDGHKSVKEFVENLKKTAHNTRLDNIRSQLVDDTDEDMLNAILSAEVQKFKDAAGVIEADERKAFESEYENEHQRLADEFISLQKEFPNLKEFKDVPKQVLQLAQKEKITLLDAQLRFQHAENKKTTQSKQSSAAASESSTGSMQSNSSDASSAVVDAMRKGIWS